ncbi:MAG: hypothetical protein H6Q59_1396 [Firmicutes bacterium]|nr:hypothetical protein [Bacillota bacterium]
MYNSKQTMSRLSEFAKISKNVLFYGDQSAPSNKPMMNYKVKIDPIPEQKPVVKVAAAVAVPNNLQTTQGEDIAAQIDLQQAIIWSEIIGKPMCKRRERRYYGD